MTDEDANERNECLGQEELIALRRENPQALFRHLQEIARAFLFGVEDRREDDEGWGGEVRMTLNRNLALHFVPGLNDAMTGDHELPQFCVMPDPQRVDEARTLESSLDDGEKINGVLFTVDPYDYDALLGEAIRIGEAYPEWDLIPDTYFLDTELIRFVTRTVLEHATVQEERRYDFRLGLAGGDGPPPIDETDLTASDMIGLPEGAPPVPHVFAGDAVEDDDEDADPDSAGRHRADERADGDDDDEDEPLTGMRSYPIEW